MMKIVIGSMVLASAIFAADGAAIYGKCVACHGKDGKTKYAGKVPALAGQDKVALIESMKGYKAGSVNKYGLGAVMASQAKIHLKDDASIEAVAEYIAGMK